MDQCRARSRVGYFFFQCGFAGAGPEGGFFEKKLLNKQGGERDMTQFGGMKQRKCMVIWRDSPYSASFGLVIFMTPDKNQKTAYGPTW